MTGITASAITTLTEAAEYLGKCRARLTRTGDWLFEAHNIPDMTGELRRFFHQNPEHRISINGGLRFVGFSDRALERLNEQLPAELQIKPKNPVRMVDKFS